MSSSSEMKNLELRTAGDWDEAFWAQARTVYEASFPEHIRKPERIVRHMLNRMEAFLHLGLSEGTLCSMALTGLSADKRLLIVDYLAVSPLFRKQGIGRQMVLALADWARENHNVHGLLIEAEADDSQEGQDRLRFWSDCGFERTAYIHRYVWVPEKYQAMLLDLQEEEDRKTRPLSRDGKKLFEQIEAFHRSSFAR